ncbi:hypothetical protein VPH35_119577 [Triticum aestivum]
MLTDPNTEPIKLSYGLLKLITEDFANEIGRGGFGVVYKKIFNAHEFSDKQFMDEINCLMRAKHENIVRFQGYCSDTQSEVMEYKGSYVMAEVQKRFLCFEYVSNGNIRQYLQQEKRGGDDWPARYKMIQGICQGLHFLHDKLINHLDLKPENIMLDTHMTPKITDFVPDSLFLQEVSDCICCTCYVLCAMYWDESLDENCPRARRCAEIARNCTDPDKHNRPTMHEIISDLDELESIIARSPANQVITTTIVVPWTELIDVYPSELRFPFVPNQEIRCHLSMTNKTDSGVYCAIIPRVADRYDECVFQGILRPRSTAVIKLSREAEEELPPDADMLEILLAIGCKNVHQYQQKLSTLSLDDDVSVEDTLKAAHEFLGLELYRTMLTAVFVLSEDVDGDLMDVHPTEPWVLIVKDSGNNVYIWNMQTKETIGIYKNPALPIVEEVRPDYMRAKFIARKECVIIGNSSGSILVRTCPSMDLVKEFKAHRDRVTSLAVHSTRPQLLSCSNRGLSLKIWDWNRGWFSVGVFDITRPVTQVMFNPNHTSTFATCNGRGMLQMWRIGHPDPVATTHGQRSRTGGIFTYSGEQHFIAAADGYYTIIWDLQKAKQVHELYVQETRRQTVAVVCHPTRPVLVTAFKDGSIRVWDSNTYRLKKAYENLQEDPKHIGFTGARRLVIGYKEGISVLDIDLE